MLFECRTRDTVVFGKPSLAEFVFAALEIDNFLGDLVSGPPRFEICFLRRLRVCITMLGLLILSLE
ncbi:hypothetical protein JCM12294_43990 [Desulfocicer niacini]